jgi:MYXO-CTERM domain-containing protein
MPVNGGMYCTPQQLCESNSDCPEAAVCTDGECTFKLNSCKVNAECDPRFVCTPQETKVRCDPGDILPPVYDAGVLVSKGGDQVLDCEEQPEPLGMCFPAPQSCEDDAECDGWVCYELPQDGNPPPGFEELVTACMPAGLIAAIEGRIAVGGDLASGGDGTSDSEASGAQGGKGEHFGEGFDAGVRGDDSPPDAAAGQLGNARDEGSASGDDVATGTDDAEGESTEDDGGCGVAGAPTRAAPWGLALFGATLLLRRRSEQKHR